MSSYVEAGVRHSLGMSLSYKGLGIGAVEPLCIGAVEPLNTLC